MDVWWKSRDFDDNSARSCARATKESEGEPDAYQSLRLDGSDVLRLDFCR